MNTFRTGGRAFVTGATGFVGAWLVKALVEGGGHVGVLVRDWDPQSELIRSGTVDRTTVFSGTLSDYATVERAVSEFEPDTVFHLGAQALVSVALRSPLTTFESNIRGTYHLLEACRVHTGLVKRVVVASSDKAYGACKELPYTEQMPPMGEHPYDVSKSCTDLLARMYHRTYGLPVVVARCGNIYGGGDLNWSRIVPGTIRSLWRGERPVIRSDGKFVRDYVYVDDVVNAYLTMAATADRADVAGEAFNFGPQQPCTVLEIVDMIRRLMGRQDLTPDIQNTARAEIRDQYLCSRKARDLLGWSPRWTLQRGLEETIRWYVSFLENRG